MFKLIRPIVTPWLRARLANFKAALRTPHESQQRLLEKIVAGLAQTEYGRALKIQAGDDYERFATKTPVATFDELGEWVERQQRTEKNVLVAEPVLFYEKTSGSSAAAKMIPYTQSLKDSFNRMFMVWLADLMEHLPQLQSGKTYMSISPAFGQHPATAQGKRVGLTDDSEYLNHWPRLLVKPFLVSPPQLKRLQSPTSFKQALALSLLAEDRLEVISIWNPSMLEIILDHIQENLEGLLPDLQRGAATIEGVGFKLKTAGVGRLSLLREKTIEWPRLWPDLKLISCWASAQAKPAAERLAAKFPDLFIQGKGLLATEAPMTLPLVEARGYVPVLEEVFFEFVDERENLRLLSGLEVGREYEIVLTQQGGLYRYLMGDRVRVTGFYEATPCLEFIGRTEDICDLVGEKLNERFVQACLSRLHGPGDYQMLLPVTGQKPHYLLVVDRLSIGATTVAAELDELLCEAFHYRQARRLGQLGGVQVCEARPARDIYFAYFVGKGQKLGDIKQRYLITNLDDATKLLASFK